MAKRFADSQITRENFKEGESDDESGTTQNHTASASVMSRRKIAIPKRKMGASFASTSSDRHSEQIEESPSQNNMFGLLKPGELKSNGNNIEETSNSNKYAKLKALNLQFKDKVLQSFEKDPCVNLVPMFNKYTKYMISISGEATDSQVISPKADQIKQSGSNMESAEVSKADTESSSDEEEKKPVKVEGPQFTLSSKPTTSDSVFKFGAKNKPTTDNDSDSDGVEVKGPQFNFTGTIKSDIFKLSGPSTEAVKATLPTDSLSKEDTTSQAEGPTVSFAANKNFDKPIEKPDFSFGSTNGDSSKTKPAFSFGTTNQNLLDQNVDAKPSSGFKFGSSTGSQPELDSTKSDKPPSFAFKFDGSTQKSEAPSKPGLSFSKTPETKEKESDVKPAFSFGSSNPAAAPSFSFSKPAVANEKLEDVPSFSFGKSAVANDKPNSVQPFSFSKASSSNDKPEGVPSFSFGKPAATNDRSEGAPSFSFSKSAATNDKPEGIPSFSFGKPTTSNDKAENAPPSGFKFNLPFAQKSPEPKKPDATEVPETKENNDPKDEINTNSNLQDASSAMNLQNGEEDETPLFTQRSKLMLFNAETKAYDSKGVGEMKLLQRKDDKSKVRLLCRSDGMGNILLNTSIVKSFTYAPLTDENENLVKIPIVESDGKLATYVVKFKQKADGRQFAKSIENAKNDM